MKRLMAMFLLLSVAGAGLGSAPSMADDLQVDSRVAQAEQARIDVMDRAKDAVLAVFSANGSGGGSGVVISADGYALTNFHVVRPCGAAMKCGMADGKLYDAVLVGLDPTGDVALIKLLGRDDFPVAELGDSDQLEPGDWAFAMGNPFLLANDFQPTVTYGIISGVHRYQFPAGTLLEYTDCIQTDASINPGNSGGPLFNAAGELIGINGRASFEKRGRVNVGAAYAISINQIKHFLGYLQSGRIVDHATLGAVVGSDDQGGVVVIDILESSDAYRRGLRFDDEIVQFAGRPIFTPNSFKNVLGIYPKGWRVPLSFRRQGQRYDVVVRLAGVHAQSELIDQLKGRRPTPRPIPEKPHPGDKPEPPPENPGPIPIPIPPPGHAQSPPKAPMPQVVRDHYEQKRGYANYYFNRLQRDRVWDAWIALGDFASVDGVWVIEGRLDGGGDFRFELSDDRVLVELPGGPTDWTSTDNLADSLAPAGSGGLAPTLYLWRRLAVKGIDQFGDVYYLGTAPLPGRDGLVDVLVGTHGGVDCHFFFDAAEGSLLAVEMFPDEASDPCEIHFLEYSDQNGRRAPGRMEVSFGDGPYAAFQIMQFEIE